MNIKKYRQGSWILKLRIVSALLKHWKGEEKSRDGQVCLVYLQTETSVCFFVNKRENDKLLFARWANGKWIRQNHLGFRFPFYFFFHKMSEFPNILIPCVHVNVFTSMSPCPCLHIHVSMSMSHVHVSVYMSPCLHTSVSCPCLCIHVLYISPCLHFSMFPCLHVSMSLCFHVSISISPCPCLHVSWI